MRPSLVRHADAHTGPPTCVLAGAAQVWRRGPQDFGRVDPYGIETAGHGSATGMREANDDFPPVDRALELVDEAGGLRASHGAAGRGVRRVEEFGDVADPKRPLVFREEEEEPHEPRIDVMPARCF